MWTKHERKKSTHRGRLNREILGLILLDLLLSTLSYFLFRSWAGSLVHEYCEVNQIVLDELQNVTVDMLIINLSFIGAAVLFIVLLLVFVGNRLRYIHELTEGIEALRTQRMDYEIPLKGNNELTELAENINYLAETERQLKAVERNLSHDIRTPLTAILSYTEYMEGRDDLTKEELRDFLSLTRQKAEQMKLLTEQLLDGGSRLTEIEDGKLLMAQLAEEWAGSLEDAFDCHVNLEQCPAFSRQLDVEELRRIFDNLASNIEKYADREAVVKLEIFRDMNRLAIRQSNRKTAADRNVESRKIGLQSISNIAKHHGGSVHVTENGECFTVQIILFEV